MKTLPRALTLTDRQIADIRQALLMAIWWEEMLIDSHQRLTHPLSVASCRKCHRNVRAFTALRKRLQP